MRSYRPGLRYGLCPHAIPSPNPARDARLSTRPFPSTAPTGLTAVVTSSGNGTKAILSVALGWTDTAINEKSFVIERCEIERGGNSSVCVFAPVADIAADATSYTEELPLGS